MTWELLTPSPQPPALAPAFAPEAFAFADALSRSLLKDPRCRPFPDLIGLGFWLREKHLRALLSPWSGLGLRPLGTVFHAAPSNVDSLFVYSGMLSVLVGNINVIRLSSRAGGSTALLLEHLRALARDWPSVVARLRIVRSSHDAPELDACLATVDGRVLWGSNDGIRAMRARPIPAHARDLTFAHKFSLAVLGAEALLRADDDALDRLVGLFARDAITFAQQGCSSPKAVAWIGPAEAARRAAARFWPRLESHVLDRQLLTESEHYLAVHAAQAFALSADGQVSRAHERCGLPRLAVDRLDALHVDAHGGCGLFLELTVDTLDSLTAMMTPAHQTVAHWGLPAEDVHAWQGTCLVGVDRVVPVGDALTFHPIWDGVDLVRTLSRARHLPEAGA